jgi:hypothetical protein
VIYLYFERLQAWLNKPKAGGALDAEQPRSA